jgi:hypothetical protein
MSRPSLAARLRQSRAKTNITKSQRNAQSKREVNQNASPGPSTRSPIPPHRRLVPHQIRVPLQPLSLRNLRRAGVRRDRLLLLPQARGPLTVVAQHRPDGVLHLPAQRVNPPARVSPSVRSGDGPWPLPVGAVLWRSSMLIATNNIRVTCER